MGYPEKFGGFIDGAAAMIRKPGHEGDIPGPAHFLFIADEKFHFAFEDDGPLFFVVMPMRVARLAGLFGAHGGMGELTLGFPKNGFQCIR